MTTRRSWHQDRCAAFDPLPVAALLLEAGIAAGLRQLGQDDRRSSGASVRASLAARFGADLLHRLDQALGLQDEPITPALPVAAFSVEPGPA